MKYFKRKYFTDDQGKRLEHSANKQHAKYGTKNSTVDEKGTDGKKNNSSEYNHEYYTENKEKWQKNNKSTGKSSGKKSSNDSLYYDKDGKARFGHKLYDPNDPDFKRTDGDPIAGTNLRVFTNQNGSLIVLGNGVKFSYPPGTQLTAEMKKEIASVEKNKGNLNDEQYVAKMHNAVTKFADNQGLDTDIAGTDKAKKKKSSSSSSSSSSKESSSSSKKKSSSKKSENKEETKTTSTSTKKAVDGNAAFKKASEEYYTGKRQTPTGETTNSSEAKKKAEELKKKKNGGTVKHSDIGSILVKDIF